jgi:dihydroorotate dehydrogenase
MEMNKECLITPLHKKLLLPFTGSPETMHNVIIDAMSHSDHLGIVLKYLKNEFKIDNMPKIFIDALKTEFYSPFLLAAGLIKTGGGAATLAQFGLGGEEIGTTTLYSRDGNPLLRKEILSNGKEIMMKRIERSSDGTIINWDGWHGPGIRSVLEVLSSTRENINVPIILNVAPNPEFKNYGEIFNNLNEVLTLAHRFKPNAITINISCGNVRGDEGEVRFKNDLWILKTSAKILDYLDKTLKHKVPRLAKIGPDMSPVELRELIVAVKEHRYQGIVATNTTSDWTGTRAKYVFLKNGALSGPLLLEKSLETVRLARKFDKEFGGQRLVIIGCGGISSYKDYQKMREAGSDEIVEMMSAFIFGGPYFFKKINSEYLRNMPVKKYF